LRGLAGRQTHVVRFTLPANRFAILAPDLLAHLYRVSDGLGRIELGLVSPLILPGTDLLLKGLGIEGFT